MCNDTCDSKGPVLENHNSDGGRIRPSLFLPPVHKQIKNIFTSIPP
jgi:hypothetical protein